MEIKKQLSPKSSFPLWEEYFTTAADAHRQSVGAVWGTDRWLDELADRSRSAKAGKPARPTSLPSVAGEFELILDFGGANGWVSELVPKQFFLSGGEYISVVPSDELRHLRGVWGGGIMDAEEAKRLGAGRTNSLVYSLSTVQYLDSMLEFTDFVQELKPRTVLLEDVPMSDGDEFYALQKYYESRLVFRFSSWSKLVSEFKEIGYILTSVAKYTPQVNPRALLRQREPVRDSGKADFYGSYTFNFDQIDAAVLSEPS